MKQRYKEITFDLCVRAVFDCFKKKWRRRDVGVAIEKYAGIPREAIAEELTHGGYLLKYEAARALAYEMLNRLERLEQGAEDALDLDPVLFRNRKDGINGKEREIAYCCIFHQLFNHLAFLSLRPLLHARITPFQFASIPNRGQTGLKNHIVKILRKKGLDIRSAKKTDICKAYPSTKYTLIIDIIEREIPSARLTIKLLRGLAKMSPSGCLIIGGYLEAWLFNFLMSYVVAYALDQRKERRGKSVPYIKGVNSFMDDFAYFASRAANLKTLIRRVDDMLGTQMNLRTKGGKETVFFTFEEERERREETAPSKRACPCVDIGGYLIHRGYVTIRKSVFLRIRRCFLRAGRELKETGNLHPQRAHAVVAYFGYLKQSNSKGVREEWNADKIQQAAKESISYHQKKQNGGNKV